MQLKAQNRNYESWINFGDSHPSKWLQIAPGKMGPNALPVPRLNYGLLSQEHEIEIGAHYHQMDGDQAINSFNRIYWNVAPGRVVIDIQTYATETFKMTNDVRDERQIYLDDTGWITEAGDLSISTHVQLIKEKKNIPDLCLTYTMKTTTGSNKHARYTDAEMNNFYLTAGKSFIPNFQLLDEIRIAAMYGFYVWQTNKVEMSQDEGPVYGFGINLKKAFFSYNLEYAGYNAYDAYEYLGRNNDEIDIKGHNDPIILRNKIQINSNHFNFNLEYQNGFRDYHYQTIRLGVIYHFKAN